MTLPPLPAQCRNHMPWAVTFLPVRQDMFALIDARHGPYPERHETIEPIVLGIQGQVEVRTMCDSYYYYYQVHARDLEPRLLARYVPPLSRVSILTTSAAWPNDVQLEAPRYSRAR